MVVDEAIRLRMRLEFLVFPKFTTSPPINSKFAFVLLQYVSLEAIICFKLVYIIYVCMICNIYNMRKMSGMTSDID